ncbi:THAP domain-containing protein 5-like [Scomber scombrus]|uniref:THAP domain-containing protein 5-like n=1 Tax=Scomber scombrus TaxID=13677 RepID=UPI002DDC03DD|nr:THAP domain-containing protein 5-like [Scomber scombrus]
MTCAAFGCTSRYIKDSGIQLFRFPFRDQPRLKQWVINIRRKDWTPNMHSRMCSVHFTEDQFYAPLGKRRLKKTAVPTIFNFPPHLMKKTTPRPTRTRLVSMTMKVSDSLVCTSAPSCSSSSNLAQPHNKPEPVKPSCSVLNDEAVADFDIVRDSGSNPDHNNAIVEENTDEKTNVVDSVLDDDIVMVVIDSDIEEAYNNDIIERTTREDSKSIRLDHNYSSTTQKHNVPVLDESPRTLKRQANAVQDKLVAVRKKLRLEQQQTRRLKSKLSSLKAVTKVRLTDPQ